MCLRSFLTISLMSLLTVSCAELGLHRSFQDQMSDEESAFFNPNEDFPVAVGDSGRSWYTEEEILERVPRTEEELEEQRRNQYLKEELASLESSLSEDEEKFYRRHKSKLTRSERIYFLNLHPEDQRAYLASRGFLESERSPASVTPSQYFGLRRQSVSLGMTKDQVMDNFGRPSRVEVAGNPRFENERWLYVGNGASKYIYFEGGVVQGWE